MGDYQKARAEALKELRKIAKLKSTITYSRLAKTITSEEFHAHDTKFHNMLGEISVEEHKFGRGLISALVVQKGEKSMPGDGFFKLAKHVGYTFNENNEDEILEFWAKEVDKVHMAHQ